MGLPCPKSGRSIGGPALCRELAGERVPETDWFARGATIVGADDGLALVVDPLGLEALGEALLPDEEEAFASIRSVAV